MSRHELPQGLEKINLYRAAIQVLEEIKAIDDILDNLLERHRFTVTSAQTQDDDRAHASGYLYAFSSSFFYLVKIPQELI